MLFRASVILRYRAAFAAPLSSRAAVLTPRCAVIVVQAFLAQLPGQHRRAQPAFSADYARRWLAGAHHASFVSNLVTSNRPEVGRKSPSPINFPAIVRTSWNNTSSTYSGRLTNSLNSACHPDRIAGRTRVIPLR